MKKFQLFLLVLAVFADGHQISEKENMELQKICGLKTGYQRKMINGEFARPGEHPWAASVYVRYLNQSTFRTLLGPGTIISPIHVIAYNTIREIDDKLSLIGLENTDYVGVCQGAHLILPGGMNSRYDVDFEFYQKFQANREFKNTVKQVTIINGCKSTGAVNPLVIELNEPIELGTKIRTAACISNSPRHWNEASQFTVYGRNGDGLLVSSKFAPTECSMADPVSCATAVDKNQGLCQGDFGGAAVAGVDGRYTILGIYASGNTRCRADPSSLAAFKFSNIGYFRQGICEVTGVCVAPPYEDVSNIPPFGEITPTPVYGQTEITDSPVDSHTTVQPTESFTEDYEDYTTRQYPEEVTGNVNGGSVTPVLVESVTAIEQETTFEEESYTMIVPEDLTRAPEEVTTKAPRIGEEGEVIVAETFKPLIFGGSGEIIAETFEPLPLGNVRKDNATSRPTRYGTININIYL
uniref:Peptidase S1 domain-containing protein n=2 Tax=Caenorhabditis tropicalis TaxID=1561998 RepID=A0A1I7T4W8_9PELO